VKALQGQTPTGATEPEATDPAYRKWDRLVGGCGYNRAWVDRLVDEGSDSEQYERAVGYSPEPR
jgi:hypothetical protein